MQQLWTAIGVCLGLSLLPYRQAAYASAAPATPPVPIIPPALDSVLPPDSCPDEVETLAEMLLRDLPSYTNRVIQRAFTGYRTETRPGTILIAGNPEFAPLSTGPGVYFPIPDSETDETLEQVFFTTLERQYFPERIADFQSFHWAFLTRTESGWRLAMMFSSFGSYPSSGPPTPPENTSEGAIAQAIELWLRDCHAGSSNSR